MMRVLWWFSSTFTMCLTPLASLGAQGSYLSACNHYSALFGTTCSSNPFTSDLTTEEAARLQEAADATATSREWGFAEGECGQCNCDC